MERTKRPNGINVTIDWGVKRLKILKAFQKEIGSF
jgi:hypothetical protein